ncbi:MAG: dihydroorotate dehydrogenase-like protein, partial [Cyanobacteria bacterium]|nr:dihydroorotate dehydrogenase-like protein [Cyanobacteriota bacterium]
MDLTTQYLGLTLKSPLVVGAAAPLTEDISNIRWLADSGAAEIVLHSLFEEQIRRERLELHHHLEYGTESFAEALSYFPEPDIFHVGTTAYLDHIRAAKAMVDIPIIASLNGFTLDGWTDYAQQIAAAGADAIELNIYWIPTDLDRSGADVEQQYIDVLDAVKAAVQIPIAVKLSPYFSNMANMAKRLCDAGADGLVLFNRFYEPDIDIEALEVQPNLILSSPADMRLPLNWIALLHGRIPASLAATSGISTAADVVKMLMAGADVTLLVATLLRHGIGH